MGMVPYKFSIILVIRLSISNLRTRTNNQKLRTRTNNHIAAHSDPYTYKRKTLSGKRGDV